MKGHARFIILLTLLISLVSGSAVMQPQKVLYVGHRAAEFEPLLKQHFAKVETIARERFLPAQAAPYDVVLLDWPQSNLARSQRNKASTPLGAREDWGKPTVLLGSAGLNLAVAWELKGGSG